MTKMTEEAKQRLRQLAEERRQGAVLLKNTSPGDWALALDYWQDQFASPEAEYQAYAKGIREMGISHGCYLSRWPNALREEVEEMLQRVLPYKPHERFGGPGNPSVLCGVYPRTILIQLFQLVGVYRESSRVREFMYAMPIWRIENFPSIRTVFRGEQVFSRVTEDPEIYEIVRRWANTVVRL